MAVPIRLDLSDPLAPRVEVDGSEVAAHVDRVALEAQPGTVPTLHLSLGASVPDEVATVAEVVAYADAGPTPREFLDGIDPQKLETEVLNRHRPGATVGQIVLEVLRERADGD